MNQRSCAFFRENRISKFNKEIRKRNRCVCVCFLLFEFRKLNEWMIWIESIVANQICILLKYSTCGVKCGEEEKKQLKSISVSWNENKSSEMWHSYSGGYGHGDIAFSNRNRMKCTVWLGWKSDQMAALDGLTYSLTLATTESYISTDFPW